MLAEEEGLLHTLEIPTVGWPLGTPPWLASDPFHPIMPRQYHLRRGTTTPPTQVHGLSG